MTTYNPALEGLAYGMLVFVGLAGYRYIKRDVSDGVKSPALPVQHWVLVNGWLILLLTLALINVYGLRLAYEIAAVGLLLVGLGTLAIDAQRGRGTKWIARTAALAVISFSGSALLFFTFLK